MLINATNIGTTLSGISRYSLRLSLYLLQNWDYPFKLAVNIDGLSHFKDFRHDKRILVCPASLSPNLGFKGNFLRLLWANKMSIATPHKLVFNTSQMEGCLIGKSQIIAIHDCIPYLFPDLHKKQYLYFKYYLPLVLRRAEKIITFSDLTKKTIRKIYKIPASKISVIYHGIENFPHQTLPATHKEDFIFFVGNPSPIKNLEVLIKALEILTTQYKVNIKLTVTCNKSDITFPIARGLDHSINFIGYVSDEKLLTLYKQAKLFVWPSLYDGFGFPPLEAMAAGCPTVVSRASCLPEICKDATIYFNPVNSVEIARTINRVLTDKSLRESLIKKGFERTQKFAWEISAKAHIKLFEALLN